MKRLSAFALTLLYATASPGQTVNSVSFAGTGLTPSDAAWGGVEVAGTLLANHGGTGLSTYVAGDLLYASSTSALSRLGIGTNAYVLTVSGGLPTWLPSSGGTVTSVSVVSANGFAGTVANATTTPAITLRTTITGILSGNGTAISAASTTGSGSTVVLSDSPTLTGTLAATDIVASGTVSSSRATGFALAGGGSVIYGDATYTNYRDGAGTSDAFIAGNTGDPTNYYNNTSHKFRPRASGTIWTTLDSSGLTTTGTLAALSSTAVGAGANTQAFVKASSTANLGFYYGTGDPTFSAAKGSIYSKTDATTAITRLWVNSDGGTTWVSVATSG